MFKWEAEITGPEDTPYHDGYFYLNIEFTKEYPFEAPKVNFTTSIYHPNIDQNGNVGIVQLQGYWQATDSIAGVLQSIVELLSQPNPENPLEPSIASVYKNTIHKFEMRARQWTREYALLRKDQFQA
jgi:ubiquitin-conjugating enzyme E2 D